MLVGLLTGVAWCAFKADDPGRNNRLCWFRFALGAGPARTGSVLERPLILPGSDALGRLPPVHALGEDFTASACLARVSSLDRSREMR